MHELGHSFWLTQPARRSGPPEPNCKPNYLSIMNYLFQVRGLPDDDGDLHMDYSRETVGALDENSLTDGHDRAACYRFTAQRGTPRSCRARSRLSLGTPAASEVLQRSGISEPTAGRLGADGARRRRTASLAPIDWNADGALVGSACQDVNFDGR